MIDVTCALIIEDNRVLIAQNNAQSDHAFQWEFPGGKIQQDESAQACIIREIREELNIQVEVVEELIWCEHHYKTKAVRLIPFVCKLHSGDMKLNDHRAVAWVNLQELLDSDLCEADQKMIRRVQNQQILKKYIGK